MLALIYVFTIWCLATILYASVDRLETDRRLALVLKLLILAVSAAATVRDCGVGKRCGWTCCDGCGDCELSGAAVHAEEWDTRD
jgi:hypothetical protein